jgi:DNA-binding NarL/FixJ family response regulator
MEVSNISPVRLVVAASHVLRDGIKDLLVETEFTVVAEAETGRQAVDLATDAQPDLMILAVNLPEMTGISALSRIRKVRPDLPVIMLSNYGNKLYLRQAEQLGASGCIVKGCPRDQFLDTVRGSMQRHPRHS